MSAVTVKLNKLLKQYRRNFPDYYKDRKRCRTVQHISYRIMENLQAVGEK